MKQAALALLLLVVIFCVSTCSDTEVVYDCSLSEISPDFPKEVREACRNLRRQQKANYI